MLKWRGIWKKGEARMIYTVTCNPALDYVVALDRLRVGALNRASASEVQPGGKGINVTTVLHRLGVESTALGFVGGFTGRALEEALVGQGIRTDFIVLTHGLTRINIKIKAEKESEINDSGPVVDEGAWSALEARLLGLKRGDVLVLSGSAPSGVPSDCYGRLLALLAGRGVEAVVDASGPLLLEALRYRPFLVKPNRQELEELMGETLSDEAALVRGAYWLREKGARSVLVSLAGEGSLLLDEAGGLHRRGAPRGTVRNSVGAGDAMVAGFLAGWQRTGDYDQAHRWGVAAGSAAAFSTGLPSAKDVAALLAELP